LGKRSSEEAPDYSERVAELRAEGRSESEIEIIFNNEENEERDQHEAKKQFRVSFNHLKKACPGEDIAGFAIDSEVEQRLEAIQKQKEKEEQEALSKIDASQFGAVASPDGWVELSHQQTLKRIALCGHTFVTTMKALLGELRGAGEGYLITEDGLRPSAILNSKSLGKPRKDPELKIAVVMLALLDWVSWD
jgi:hypothetical protein